MEHKLIFESLKKIIIFGNKKVGKTSLISKIKHLKNDETYKPSESKILLFK